MTTTTVKCILESNSKIKQFCGQMLNFDKDEVNRFLHEELCGRKVSLGQFEILA
jgi:hypothetical protein